MINRRNLIKTGAAIGATLSMPWVARAAGQKIRLTHAANEVHPSHKMATSFADALAKLVPGAFDLQIFPNRQLGSDKQNLESTVAGTIELANVSGILVPLVTGQTGLDSFQLPFLLRDYDHFGAVAKTDAFWAIHKDLEKAGLVGLATADTGQRHFLSAGDPVKTVADFAGLKTRIVPVPLHKAIWEAVGTSPVGLPYGEIYGALETKVIDAVEINVSSMLGENLWEVGKNFTLTGHYPWHSTTIVNKDFFDGLTPELQEAMREAGRQSIVESLAYAKDQDINGRDELRAKGVNIFELEGLDQMQAKVAPIVDQWGAKNPLIADLVKAARST